MYIYIWTCLIYDWYVSLGFLCRICSTEMWNIPRWKCYSETQWSVAWRREFPDEIICSCFMRFWPRKRSNSPFFENIAHSLKLTWHLKIGHPKRKLIFQPSIFRCYISFREGNHQFPSILKLNPWFACIFFIGVLFYIPPFVLHLPNKTPLDMSWHAPGEPQPADGKVDLPWVLGRALKALRNDSWRLLLEPWHTKKSMGNL